MDPQNSESQRKTAAVKEFIAKQSNSGVEPKGIYQQLTARKVPQKLAADLIKEVLAERKQEGIPQVGTESSFTERQQKIIKWKPDAIGKYSGQNNQ